MSASRHVLRMRRRRSVPPPSAPTVPFPVRRLPVRRVLPTGLLAALMLSGAAHALLLNWDPPRPDGSLEQRIVVRTAPPSPSREPSPPPPPPPPTPEPEPSPPPPVPAATSDPPPPPPPPRTHRPRTSPPAEPVPEVLGVDSASTSSSGIAVPVGNTLMIEPEESADVDHVEPLGEPVAAPPPPPPPPPPAPPPPPPPSPRTDPYAVDEVTEPPQFVRRAPPRYTDSALDAEVEGTVLVRVVIAADGRVRDARIVHGLGFGLDEEAISAARSSTYRPARLGGQAVACVLEVPYRFALDG